MKTLKYIALSLLAAACTTACKDDPELLTTDVGPEMTAVSSDASGVFGGKVGFEATMTDRYALSTLKAQIFFDDEMVAEEVIRTKENGTYSGTVTLPFYKNVPDGEATLRLVGQNVRFGQTFVERPLAASRPKPDHLVFVLGEQEYRMEPTGVDYEYAVTADFPQKPQGYITTPDLDGQGSVVTFGYSSEQGGIVSDSTEPIPFANSNAGEFTVTFNLKSFEGSPFIKLLFNDAEMTMVDNDNYSIVTTLTQNQTYTLTGVSDFADWDIDRDFFERADASNPEALTFLPMSGMYKVTANFKHSYLRIEAMKSATELATLNEDGSGAIWAIGGMSVGKPTLKNAASWSPEQGGMCLARVADKKYQLTFVAGVSIDASSFDFKFFHQKTWGGEFGGDDILTASDLVKISDSGNLGLAEGKTLDLGGIYRFTVDISGGNTAAVLTVEKVGEQELPPADITVNGTKMTQLDMDNYQVDLDLTQGQTLTLGGADAFSPAWINPDFFEAASATSVKLVPVSGKYRITANLATKVIDALVLNADGSGLATLSDDGHGAVYFIGYGIGSPAAADEPGWTTEKGVCVPEAASGIYRMTAQAGVEGSTVLGQRFRVSGWSGKFFKNRGWDGLGTFSLAAGTEAFFSIAGDGNIEIAQGVTLEEGATYELTLDVTGGNDHPVVSLVKK
ncbi:DUF5125 domain-containing protein [Alistipes senegalensis]|uniref:DUF5125 domain-containing protein n=1 Tax=Alistipes senegalensis TaxID=1288121 RepID=UPI00242D7BEA|nr:DUF5125 domain-containing protein [Alistipes senegalensis]MCI7308373.1 DUF5125 domain-containing protein [Alistipes senegalensis]MDD7037791.1 DUF5125 domain-containing protein [Alistipes senegalensis]MDY2876017.1 DUF5125 domain-containing protein [Alistipes senegalensis]